MEKINDKMAKLASEADGNIVGESFIIQPDKGAAAKLGVLFGVIEVYNINDTFLDGFLNAVSDLKTEYFLPPFNSEKGVEKRFEEAISRANRRIFAAFNQSVEEIDLRNVSAAIGLFHDNKVYLSSAGRVKGLFYRRKKSAELLIIDILSGNGEARFRPEPEKLFANILSGELTERDAVLLINEEFLGFFSQKELGETVLDNGSAAAVRSIEESLKEKVAKKNFYAVIISPVAEPPPEPPLPAAASRPKPTVEQPIAADPFREQRPSANPISGKIAADARPQLQSPLRQAPPTQQSIDKLLITQVRTEKYLAPSLLPQWQKILLILMGGIKKASSFTYRYAKQLVIFAITKIKRTDAGKKSGALRQQTALPPETIQLESSAEEMPFDPPAEVREEIISGDFGDILDLESAPDYEQMTEQPLIVTEELPLPKRRPGGLTDKINGAINAQIEKFLAHKKGQQIVLALGLALIFLFSQSVVMIGRSSDKGQSSSSKNDIISRQIDDQLNNAEAQNIFNDESGALLAIKNAREILAKIPDTRLNKSFKSGLQDKIDQSARALQKIVSLDNPPAVADFLASGSPAQPVGLAKTGKVYWEYDNLSRVLLRFDTATQQLTQVTTTLPQAKQIAALDDKNLILLGTDKAYYKFDIAKRAASKIKPAKDWFQVKAPGSASPLIDPPLASSTVAMSALSENYYFFLDGGNGRVVVLDKNGILKRQFYSDKFKGADALSADAKDKKIWVSAGGKAYQIDLDF